MDNRLKFLYRIYSEMWGHGKGSGAGNGKPGASEVVSGLENPVQAEEEMCRKSRTLIQRRDVDRTIVGKPVSWLPRKAAIVSYKPVP